MFLDRVFAAWLPGFEVRLHTDQVQLKMLSPAADPMASILCVPKATLRRHPVHMFRLCFVLLVIYVACSHMAFSSSARPRTSRAYRKDSSLKLSKPVPIDRPEFKASLSGEEKILVSRLSGAGKRRRWLDVKKLFGSYTGQAVPVYCAAMQAAYRCGRYKEGAKFYRRLREFPNVAAQPVGLHLAVKIFGKLQMRKEVGAIWNEIKENGWVDEIRAAGRIDAAAEMGDIVCAAEVLDYMGEQSLKADINHFNSAINACKNAKPPNRSAAMFLYEQLREEGLQPTISTFTVLMGTHTNAPLSAVLKIRAELSDAGLQLNTYFADSYMNALLQGRPVPTDQRKAFSAVSETDAARLQEVRLALDEFQMESNNVMTPLCIRIDSALRKVMP